MASNKNWSLYAATMLALGSTAAGAAAQEAVKQAATESAGTAADAAPVEVVRVTGSRIVRRDNDTVGPMLTLTKDDIKYAAPTSVGDLLQAMPNVGVSLNSNGTQGTAFGVSSINLRYLGSAEGSGNRTLVLVDGHRWVNATGGRGFRDFVDLNSIPLGMIDHIEVLKDGASAIYGADAIAGVVNIHTRRKLEGFETDLRIGESSRSDARNYNGFINWGTKLDKGSVFLSASYNDSKPILTADRDATRAALSPLTAAPTSPQGLYVLPGLSNNKYFGTGAGFASNAANAITRNQGALTPGAGALADDSFHTAALPGDYYNTQTQGIYSNGPSRRAGLFGRLTYRLNDDITAHVEGMYSTRESSQLFAPFPLDIRGSNGFAIPVDQQYNPFGTANGVPAANALGFSGSAFRIQRVPTEVGNRNNIQNVDTARLLLGVNGKTEFYGDWDWDATLSRTTSRATFDSNNQLNLDHIYLGIGSPAKCTATPGCVPLNLFGSITPAMADYMRYNAHDANNATQTDFAVNATRTLMELQGGSLGLAAGYEYRKEEAEDMPDAFVAAPSTVQPLLGGAAQATTTSPARDITRGSYSLQEAYAELSAPILSGLPGIEKLELDAAVRYSRYSTVGGKATSKLGVLYRPVASLLARGTYSQGFRAPSILELYQGQRQTNFQTVDPCNGGGTGKPGCAGVPAGYNQSQFNGGLTPGITAGNVNLKPETADTYSLGLVWTPASVPGLSFNADKFLIKVKDAIASQTGTQIMQACANTGNYCDLVLRNPTGEVRQLTQAVVNLSRIEVAGIDATARYVFPVASAKIDSALDVSYLEKYRSYVPQSDGTVVVDDRAGKSDQPRSTFPRVKAQASLRYLASNYSATWKARYIGHSADLPNNAVNGGTVPAITYQDVQLGYTLPGGKVNLAFGIDNLWDKQPPLSAANNPINFDIYTYDVRGRYFYAKVSSKF
ncbi:TonB-dependent receptor [Duganella sp. LjRoot269]|uniref:TonB-dependent receptor n=1 Tax=Duganella sp. LjRoot269 TaxID=3342305 RepID=UPI003ECEA3D3